MDNTWPALWLSLQVATWATLACLVLGTGVGYALARWRFPGRDLVDTLLTLPMVMPPTVLGYYLLVLLGRKGWLGGWVHDTVRIPLLFPLAEAVDPQLQDAARVLGISEAGVFWRVTLPLAWRGILAGVLLGFARALGEFGATLMVAGSIPGKTQTLSIAVYEAVQAGQDDVAHLLVLITSVVCVAVLLAVGKLAPGRVATR